MRLLRLIPAALAAVAFPAMAAFTGDFAPANWTPNAQSFGCGTATVDQSAMPASVTLRTLTGCASIGASYNLTNPVATSGTISFSWVFSANNFGQSGLYAVDGATTVLANGPGATAGTATVPVLAGQTFLYGLNGGVNANLTISNFSFVPAVVAPPAGPASIPTLSEWGLIIMSALIAMFGIARTRRRR